MDNLSERASLVALKISTWTGRCVDKEISQDVLRQHMATDDAGSFSKRLMPKEALKPIAAVLNEARKYYKSKTLAWEDGKSRLLPATLITEFHETMRDFQVKLEDAADEFIQNYDRYKKDAEIILNGLYREGDYPSVKELKEKFSMEYPLSNITDPSDFRCEVSEDLKQEIQKNMKTNLDEKYSHSIKKLYERIFTVIKKFNERLQETDAKFHNSLIGNIEDLVSLMPDLNFMNDDKITSLTDQIQNEICQFSVGDLRYNTEARKKAVKASSDIMDTMGAIL
jgi:hypothetical protein